MSQVYMLPRLHCIVTLFWAESGTNSDDNCNSLKLSTLIRSKVFNKSYFISQLEPFQWFPANHFTFYFSLELFSGVTLRSRHLVNNFFAFYSIKSSLGNIFDSVFWNTRKVILLNYIYIHIYVCVYINAGFYNVGMSQFKVLTRTSMH